MKKTTVKKIKEWLKTLEENRYKKRYMSDARRIAWFVNNNLSEDYEGMPISLRKKCLFNNNIDYSDSISILQSLTQTS